MKVSGFTIVRNAIKFGYPVKESILSVLPLCDEMIVAVGQSEDGTRELIASLNDPKIKIIDTVWDETLRLNGKVLAVETDKAFSAIASDSNWCIYIQADEVLHEQDYPAIKEAMRLSLSDKKIDGILFKYKHFWGSFDFISAGSRWYRNEIRIVRNDPSIYSYRDAQGFRKGQNKKLNVKKTNAFIYHYGWVREPKTMDLKIKEMGQFWNAGKETENTGDAVPQGFDYKKSGFLQKFIGVHPAVMKERIKEKNWDFEIDPFFNKQTIKDFFKNTMERLTGIRPFDYKNYREL